MAKHNTFCKCPDKDLRIDTYMLGGQHANTINNGSSTKFELENMIMEQVLPLNFITTIDQGSRKGKLCLRRYISIFKGVFSLCLSLDAGDLSNSQLVVLAHSYC